MSTSPLLLCSFPGFDASGKVDALADARPLPFKSFHSVSMGSAEGFVTADAAIASSARDGSWVLLRNVHLCPEWLGALEKRLHALRPHDAFRLFLTSEVHPALPVPLLRQSRVVVFEPPSGLQASLRRCVSQIPAVRLQRAPVTRSRLYVLLAWCHAVIQERLRYHPIGWTKAFEFSDTDFQVGLDTIDSWLVRWKSEWLAWWRRARPLWGQLTE